MEEHGGEAYGKKVTAPLDAGAQGYASKDNSQFIVETDEGNTPRTSIRAASECL